MAIKFNVREVGKPGGNFGSFHLSTKSLGSDLEEEVAASNIMNAKLLFYSGKQIQSVMRNLTFKKNST